MWLSNARKTLNKTFSILVIFCLASFGCSKEEKEINVYAASSLTEAISAVIKNYEEIYEVKTKVVFAGSNHLAAQLRDGADADVFITANADLINDLDFQEILEGFAYNSLIAVKPVEFINKIFEPNDLNRDENLIAICSEGVPCGDTTKAKFGNVKADTYLQNEPKVTAAWPQEINCPCVSYAAASKGGEGNDFIDFLDSDTAEEIFSKYGFSL